MKRIKSTNIITGDEIISGYVYYENGRIAEVTDQELPFTEEYDAGDNYVSPGFIDIHTHGGGGYAFEHELDDVVNGCNFPLSHGTTSICPTISAAPFDSMAGSVKNIKQAMEDPRVKSNIIGAHMEGPYLSLQQTGAQGAEFITPPCAEDYERLIADYGESIARWSYAPENDTDGSFCKHLVSHGIVPSAGHTNAIGSEMSAAAKDGCRLITHLYSCTSTITRDHGFRRLGVIETAFLDDGIDVEIIADGKHLPPDLIRLIYKIKGPDRLCMVTDSMRAAGMPEGDSEIGGLRVIVKDGVAYLRDMTAFAGSVATTDRLVRVMHKQVGIPLVDCITMMCRTPARVMNLSRRGELRPGYFADLVFFDGDINVKKVLIEGRELI